jgi:DNA-binding MarR family transcriptional regulator
MPGMEAQRPIGWWVKRLDALLEQAVDSAVAGEGLTRRHWQVLHSLADDAGPEGDLRSTLADFTGDVGAVVTDLVGRGWVQRSADDGLALTPEGRAGQVRRHVADGLSAAEYEQTVRILSRMVDNVRRSLARS